MARHLLTRAPTRTASGPAGAGGGDRALPQDAPGARGARGPCRTWADGWYLAAVVVIACVGTFGVVHLAALLPGPDTVGLVAVVAGWVALGAAFGHHDRTRNHHRPPPGPLHRLPADPHRRDQREATTRTHP